MTKEVHCRDLGFDCDGVVRSDSEEELMAQVAEHAKNVHHLNVTNELADQVKSVIRVVR
jgi:predicted small metal-binding protein